MTVLKIYGRTRFETPQGEVTPWAGTRQRQLVELLAVSHPAPVSKSRLVDALWDGQPPATALRTLESHVCVVRRQMEESGLPRDLLVTENDGYRFSERLVVDLTTVRRFVAEPLAAPGAWQRVLDAVRLAEQPLLASSPYAPWALLARYDTEHLLAEACTTAAEVALVAGQHDDAASLAARAQATLPLSERACRAAMRAHAALGDRCQALRLFADFRELVRDDLGVEPTSATVQVYLEVLQDGLDSTDGGVPVALGHDERRLLCLLLTQAAADGPRLAPVVELAPDRTSGRSAHQRRAHRATHPRRPTTLSPS